MRILSSDLSIHLGKSIMVQGHLHNLRIVSSKLAFLILRDRGGLMQIVLESEIEIKKLEKCMTGSIIYAQGKVTEMTTGKFHWELQESTITIHRSVSYPSPIDISKEELLADGDTLHEHKVVALRHLRQIKIFSLTTQIEKHIRDFLDTQGCTQINTPKIIAFPTEGGSEVFEIKYFDRSCYLAQSPQFYKQMMVPVFERVYEIGRAYRAEKSHTSRHMSEILMLDVEIGFIDSLNDVLNIAQSLLQTTCNTLREKNNKDLEYLGCTKPLLAQEFPRISVAELHNLYFQETGIDLRDELDLSPSEEQFICEYSKTHWGSEAIFVIDFSRSDAKFYHYQDRNNPTNAQRADLLFRGVEIATLTRREVEHERLIQQIKERGMDPEHPGLYHYLEAFKYGMPESGGFGLGIARYVQKLLGLENVKQAELFPRDTQRITP